MLHLKFALNLEKLADEMMDSVQKAWKNPFVAPIIVFPDPKLEQWFRLRWVQKKGSLANFNSMMIDRFLMEILVGDDISKQKLNSDVLQSVILAYLYEKNEQGEPNYKSLGDEVIRYLDVDGKLDENHIFDLSMKMASMFLEYETSRPAGFVLTQGSKCDENGRALGILDCWKQGNLKDFFDGGPREKWQRELYSKIFHQIDGRPSLLSGVFEAMNARKNAEMEGPINVNYLTIPFLYKTCEKFHCESFTDGEIILPVFIFGLSGMGQFYRVILQKFADEHDIYAFIQNPCMDFWEDVAAPKKYHHWEKSGNRWTSEGMDLPENLKRHLQVSVAEQSEEELEKASQIEEGVDAETENALLCNWGRSGRDNIKLWCQAANYDFEFESTDPSKGSDNSNQNCTSLLRQIQSMVAERKNCSQDLLEIFEAGIDKSGTSKDCGGFANDSTFSLTSAPTREREIQVLHSRICKLLTERDDEGNPVNRISDIMVFSPDLDNYRTAIYQGFDQTSKDGLHIPFSIVDSPARASLTANALADLCGLLDPEVQTINRPTFFSLMRNPVVQHTRGITDEDVEAWEGWIENIHMYRDRNEKQGDWKNGLRRLLLSKFTDEDFAGGSLQGEELRPYSDIASGNNKSLCKFADTIEELDQWIDFAKKHKTATPELLDEVIDKLSDWISMPFAPEGFAGETIVYKQISAGFDILKHQFDAGRKEISWPCIIQTLNCAAESAEYSCGNLFVNGITFAKFIPNRIIPVKHVFFIGASSAAFPGNNPRNTLDLRNNVAAWPGDDTPVAKKRYAFLCQFMSTSSTFHLSYVNKNIAKDEDLYATSIVSDIRNFLKNAIKKSAQGKYGSGAEKWLEENKSAIKNIWPEIEIPLDEKRPYSQLFTPKEWRNRATYDGMVNPADKEDEARKRTRFHWEWENLDAPGKQEIVKIPERVSFREIQKFLEDPFQFRIARMLDVSDREEDVDPETEYFEPVDFNNLSNSILVNAMVAAAVTGKNEDPDKLIHDLKLNGELPDNNYGEKLLKSCQRKCDCVIGQMESVEEDSPTKNRDSWSHKEKLELAIPQNIQGQDIRWILSGTLPWCNADRNHLVSITSSKPKSPTKTPNFKQSKYLNTYVAAIALIAQKKSDSAETIKISIYSSDMEAVKPAEANVTMTSCEAMEILQKIYQAAFVEQYSKAVPADMLSNEYNIFGDYAKDLADAWKFFGKRNTFDKRKDIGFTTLETFTSEWNEARKHQQSLINMNVIC
ncbi:MAG: exodeoxyribonuclease V subunit gamma [Fibrobacter sp.]|nr:exodeoxyribonuclease V subunit gamma [Fibrobacter sp.]